MTLGGAGGGNTFIPWRGLGSLASNPFPSPPNITAPRACVGSPAFLLTQTHHGPCSPLSASPPSRGWPAFRHPHSCVQGHEAKAVVF